MALSFLNLGAGTNAYTDGSGTYLAGDPAYPNPADFTVVSKTETKASKTVYSYEVSERTAGAFTLFALGNFLDPTTTSPYFQPGLIENSKVSLKGNITGAGIGLGWGEDALKVEGSASVAVISTDADPSPLLASLGSVMSVPLSITLDDILAAISSLIGGGSPVIEGNYTDSVEIRGDANLTLIGTGLGSDTVKVGGALQASVVLLDGLSGIGGDGGSDAGKDKLEVGANSSLALISCGANDDSVRFKAGAIAIDVNGGEDNDTIAFDKGLTGNLVVTPGATPPVDYQLLDAPLGVVAGGCDSDRINFGGGSASYGIAIFGDDPLTGYDATCDGNDTIAFGKGSLKLNTFLRNSVVDLGGGADALNFGDYTSLKDVLINCGGDNGIVDGGVDTINFSTLAGAAMFKAVNVLVVNFGNSDKITYSGTTYTGLDALTYFNVTNTTTGITVVAPVV